MKYAVSYIDVSDDGCEKVENYSEIILSTSFRSNTRLCSVQADLVADLKKWDRPQGFDFQEAESVIKAYFSEQHAYAIEIMRGVRLEKDDWQPFRLYLDLGGECGK